MFAHVKPITHQYCLPQTSKKSQNPQGVGLRFEQISLPLPRDRHQQPDLIDSGITGTSRCYVSHLRRRLGVTPGLFRFGYLPARFPLFRQFCRVRFQAVSPLQSNYVRSLHTQREYAAVGGPIGFEGHPVITPPLQHCSLATRRLCTDQPGIQRTRIHGIKMGSRPLLTKSAIPF